MSSSTLSKAPTGEFGSPETNDAANAAETKDPFAGTWLESYSAEMRREILGSLEADRNPQEDADRVDAVAETRAEPTQLPFGIDTYPAHLQEEIRKSLHLDTVDELDAEGGQAVAFPNLPTPEEVAAQDEANARSLREYLARGSRRNVA